MRYESPINGNAFRDPSADPSVEHRDHQRVSIRPLAGASVGTTLEFASSQATAEVANATARPVTPSKSRKQGPSHRKLRRWNNDNFVGLAAEVAKAGGVLSAEAMIQAQADASSYRSVYNPLEDQEPSALSHLLQDRDLAVVKERFRDGAAPAPLASNTKPTRPRLVPTSASPKDMLARVPDRLRHVLERACSNSADTVAIIDDFEKLVVKGHLKGRGTSLAIETLLEPPTVTKSLSGEVVLRFCFDSMSTIGGFHRLLLHAVALFHGLRALSKTMVLNDVKTRMLTIQGTLVGPEHRLAEHVIVRISKEQRC